MFFSPFTKDSKIDRHLLLAESMIWVWLKINELVAQVLVYVSTYQHSILEFRFFEPYPFECSRSSTEQIGDVDLPCWAQQTTHLHTPARSGRSER